MGETLRFENCSKQLWYILHPKSDFTILGYRVGIIFSDFPLAKEIPIAEKVTIKNQGRYTQGILQTYLLSMDVPEINDFIKIECYFPEAVACLLSFTFRSPFQASRVACRFDESGQASDDSKVFLAINSNWVRPLTPQTISLKTEKERSSEFEIILKIIKKMEFNDYKRIMKSFRLYQLALLTYSLDIGLSYSLLVSAVDTISCQIYKEIKGSNAKFVKFVEDNLPDAFWVSFDSRALEEQRYFDNISERIPESPNLPKMVTHTLLDYEREQYAKHGIERLEPLRHALSELAFNRILESFVKKEELPAQEKEAYEHVIRYWHLYRYDEKLSEVELAKTLKEIYRNVRSAFFHSGESPSDGAVDNYETVKIKSHITDDYKVVNQRDIPSFYWFERVAHDCILNYLSKNF